MILLSESGDKEDREVFGLSTTRASIYVSDTENTPPDDKQVLTAVLGALDERIGLNRRMNATLDAMALAMFERLFVNFDPVVANAMAAGNEIPEAIKASVATRQALGDDLNRLPEAILQLFPSSFVFDEAMGWVPEGWGSQPVYDVANFINGAKFKMSHFSTDPEALPVVKITELKNGISGRTKFTNRVIDSKYRIKNGDVMFSFSGDPFTSIDVFVWGGGHGWLNQHISRVCFYSNDDRSFVYYLLKWLKPVFARIAKSKQTTGLGHVTVMDMKKLYVINPGNAERDCFRRFSDTVLEMLLHNATYTNKLTGVRDTLRPKLMTGRIRIAGRIPAHPVDFDTASTTPVAPEVVEKMVACLGSDGCYANPSSAAHLLGQTAHSVVQSARSEMAIELGCKNDEIIFTSGATEANNLALRGVAIANATHGRHLITSAIEHSSVLESCRALEREGFAITYLVPNHAGWIEPEMLKCALQPDTLLVSLMHTNNETGAHQPLETFANLLVDAGVLFHVDAAQAAGKFSIDINSIPIDLLSLSAHKFHGPKGAGCLVVRNRRQLHLHPIFYGGGQEFDLRSGTLATHQIVGMSAALRLSSTGREADFAHVVKLKRTFLEQLGSQLAIQVHGDSEHSSPYIINFSIAGIGSDALINQLWNKIAISSGSACSSGTIEPSYVLRAMGIEGDDLYGAVRVSFSRDHSTDDILYAVEEIVAAVNRMREMD